MFALTVTDFDGTLAKTDKTISDYTVNVIRAYRQNGGIFTIATGRMTEGILFSLNEVGITDDIPVISYQGADIRLAKSGKILHSSALDSDLAEEIISYCKTQGIFCQTYDDGMMVCETEHPHVARYCQVCRVSHRLVPDLCDLAKHRPLKKILTWIEEEQMPAIKKQMEKRFGDRCKVCQSSRHFLEFFDLNTDKGKALRFLANYYNVPIQSTMAFGDQFNDLEMIRAAGFGVAVQNAVPELRNAADYVAESNDLDGVAKTIARYNGLLR